MGGVMDMSLCRNQVTEDELDEIIDKFSISEDEKEENKRCQNMWKAVGFEVTPSFSL